MLGAIKDAIMGLYDTVVNIFSFLGSFLTGFLDFFDKALEVIQELPVWLSYMPTFIISSILSLIGLIFILRIIGRS